MAYSFSKKFNKTQLFKVDTTDYEYLSLEDAYEKYGEEYEYVCMGCYINTDSMYHDEEGVIATDKEYLNLPHHLLSTIKEIRSDKQAVQAINSGQAVFKIRKYYKKRYSKECYTIEWQE